MKILLIGILFFLFGCKNSDTKNSKNKIVKDTISTNRSNVNTTLDSLQGYWMNTLINNSSIAIIKDSFFYINKKSSLAYVGKIYIDSICQHDKRKLKENVVNGSFINVTDSISDIVTCYSIIELTNDTLNLIYDDYKGLGLMIRKK